MTRNDRPSGPVFIPNPKLKLLDQYREALRFWHYSYRTEQTYLGWFERYLRFCRGVGRIRQILVRAGHGGIHATAARRTSKRF